jgi:hypothetical protein
MEAAQTSEMLVSYYNIQCHNPEDLDPKKEAAWTSNDGIPSQPR